MADPTRLQDASDDALIVEMLAAARSEAPRQRSYNKAFLAVGSAAGLLGGQATAGAATATGVASASLVKLAAKWTLLSTVVVGGGVTATEVVPRIVAGHSAETVQDSARAHEHASAPALQQRTSEVRRTSPEPAPSESASDLPTLVGPRKHATPEERLAVEVALLDRARLALAHGDFDRASRLADEYLTRYAGGRLEQEARYLKMQAERDRGHRSEAEQEAERLLELNPSGPHARAAREVLK